MYSTSGAKRRENTPPETPMLWAISACADPTAALSAYAELAGLPDPAALALLFRYTSGSIEMIARSEGGNAEMTVASGSSKQIVAAM